MLNRSFCLTIFILLFLFFLSIPCLEAQDSTWIKESINLTINAKFDQAESLLVHRIDTGDSSITALFYYASIFNSKMSHYESYRENKTYLALLDKLIYKGEKQLKRYDINAHQKAELLFYVGSAYGYKAYLQGKIGQWYSALKNGSSATDYLEKAVQTDSTIYDAYLGLGSYDYWKSTKLSWLPFVPDRREEGIKLVRKAIRGNAYSKYMAMHQLVYILLDYGHYNDALSLVHKMILKYPQSPFMRWAESHVYMKMHKYPEAIESYKKIYALLQQDVHPNPVNKTICLARMADMYSRQGMCREAMARIRQILENELFVKNENDEVKNLIGRVKKLCAAQKE